MKEAQFINGLRAYIKGLFNLQQDKEKDNITIKDIRKGVEFKGPKLWILLFATLIASIGLNVNSTAVVIGAMLISPLMGPIMGIGLGAGINDLSLIKKSFRSLSTAAILSILTSALYFYATPLNEAQSELLSRTTPNLWDVLIAFFGGLTGIVAGSRKEKSTAIPGVAIATALMPPLCTAGYGLANGNMSYLAGALYLFLINSVFISVATFLIVRALRYPKVQFENSKVEKKVKSIILIFVILTLIPSISLAYNMVKQTIFEQSARTFVLAEFDLPDTKVIIESYELENSKSTIDLTLFGRRLAETDLEIIRSKLSYYGLEESELIVRQSYHDDFLEASANEFKRMSEDLRIGLLEDMNRYNETLLNSKQSKIEFLEAELSKHDLKQYPLSDIEQELSVHYPGLRHLAMGDILTSQKDTVCYAILTLADPIYKKEENRIIDWLKIRSKADSLVVIFQ